LGVKSLSLYLSEREGKSLYCASPIGAEKLSAESVKATIEGFFRLPFSTLKLGVRMTPSFVDEPPANGEKSWQVSLDLIVSRA
jgi:hypothetical protein